MLGSRERHRREPGRVPDAAEGAEEPDAQPDADGGGAWNECVQGSAHKTLSQRLWPKTLKSFKVFRGVAKFFQTAALPSQHARASP